MASDEELRRQYRANQEIIQQLDYIKSIKESILRLDGDAKDAAEEELALQKSILNEFVNIEKKTSSAIKSFARLTGDVKKNLGNLNSQSNTYINIQRQIIKEEETRTLLTEAEVEASEARTGFLRDISSELLAQAKATAKAEQDARGINVFEQQRKELLENNLNLTQEQLDLAKDLIDQQETLFKKEQRLLSIKESQKSLYEAMPDSLKGAVEFGKSLGDVLKTAGAGAVAFMLLATVVTATIKSFTDLDASAKEFRETTGLTNSQMAGIKSDANEIVGQFGNLGIEAKNVFDTVAALKSEFSDIADFSQETTAALTVLGANFGVSAQNAAKVQGVLEQVGGLSSETAASVQLQVANMSKLAGVAPAKVFEDIAESAEISSTLFKGDTIALAKNAIEARRLGTNLKSVAATAEKLLDFESGIEEELVAATFVGGQFNLSRARALAFEGKIVESQKEILAQVQRTGDFRQKDYFTQQQLAKAAGMSVEEINKQLNAQEKLSKLSTEERAKAEKAIEQGLDITNINAEQLAQETEKFSIQQEQQSALEKLQNAFTGIASTIGSSLTPLLEGLIPILDLILLPIQAIATGFAMIVEFAKENIPLMITLGSLAGIFYAKTIAGAVAKIWSSVVGALGPLGIPVAVAASLGAISMAKSAFSSAGDVFSPADGKTRISTKEGGLFELSPNDDLIAAPGIASKMGSSGGTTDSSTILIGPLNALLGEIRGLRTDMSSGKIGVYMDTEKVTSKISRQVDSSTRNNFNLGQA